MLIPLIITDVFALSACILLFLCLRRNGKCDSTDRKLYRAAMTILVCGLICFGVGAGWNLYDAFTVPLI